MQSSVPLSDKVLTEIERKFAPDEAAQVRNLLLQYGVHPLEIDVERIRLDIPELANGNIIQVAHWLKLAKKDYRDLIMAAEYQLVEGKIVRKPPRGG